MAVLASELLRSQRLTHAAAIAERQFRLLPESDTPQRRESVHAHYQGARFHAGNFAVYADFFEAANDEPPTT